MESAGPRSSATGVNDSLNGCQSRGVTEPQRERGPCGLVGAGSNIGIQTLSYIYKVTIGAQVDKINFYFFSTKVLGSLKPSFKKVSSVPLLTDKSKFE